MTDVFAKAIADLKLPDFAGDVPPLPKLQQPSSLDILREAGVVGQTGGRRSIDIAGDLIRMERDAKKAAGAADPTLAIPSWQQAIAGIQGGYDNLTYEQKKQAHDTYVQRAVAELSKIDTKTDPMLLEQKVVEQAPAPVKPKRSGAEVITDPLLGLGAGLVGFAATAAAFGEMLSPMAAAKALTGAGQSFEATQWLQGQAERLKKLQSAVEQDTQKQLAADMAALKKQGYSLPRELWEEARATIANLSLGTTFELAGGTIPGLLVGGGVGTAVVRTGVRKALAESGEAAVSSAAKKAIAARAATAATATGAAIEGITSGGEAASETYQTLSSPEMLPALRESKQWANELRKAGGNEQLAQESIARDAARVAGSLGAATASALSLVPGSWETLVGKVVAKRAGSEAAGQAAKLAFARRFAASTATEGLTEVAPTVAANVATGAATDDLTLRSALEGAGGSFALGALAGSPAALVSGDGQAAAPTPYVPPGTANTPGTPGTVIEPEMTDEELAAAPPDKATVAPGTAITEGLVMGDNGVPVYVEGAEPNLSDDAVIASYGTPAPASAVAAAPTIDDVIVDPLAGTGLNQPTPPTIELTPDGDVQIAPLTLDQAIAAPTTSPIDEALRPLLVQIANDPTQAFEAQWQIAWVLNMAEPAAVTAARQVDGPTKFALDTLGVRVGLEQDPASPWQIVMRTRSRTKDTGTVLDAIINAPEASAVDRQVAGLIRQAYAKTKIPLPKVTYTGTIPRRGSGVEGGRHTSGLLGERAAGKNEIRFNPASDPQTVNHEAMHGLTVNGLQILLKSKNPDDQAVVALIKHLHAQLKKSAGKARPYGNTNIYEMYAELVSPEFLALAARTPLGQLSEQAQRGATVVEANSGSMLDAISGIVSYILKTLDIANIPADTVLDMLQRTASFAASRTAYSFDVATDPGTPGFPTSNPETRTSQSVVFHGTPYSVDKFSLQKIGTGEGAQAYGWGMYFAGKKEVAEFYRKGLSERNFINLARDSYNEFDSPQDALNELRSNPELSPAQVELLDALQADGWLGFDYPHQAISEALRRPQNWDLSPETQAALKKQGNTYQVQVPDDRALLDWDKPLSEQPDSVKAAFAAMPDLRQALNRIFVHMQWDGHSGANAYQQLAKLKGGPQGASETLMAAGVPGLRYLDGTSRASGDGTANYVIWDEAQIGAPETISNAQEVDTAEDTAPEIDNDVKPGNRTSTGALSDDMRNGVPASPATAGRGAWQALLAGDWEKFRKARRQFYEAVNVEFHDASAYMKRWLQTLPETDTLSGMLKDSVIGSMYTARKKRDDVLRRMYDEHLEAIDKALNKLAKKRNSSLETVLRDVGYASTAKTIPTRNASLLRKRIKELAALQKEVDDALAAQQTASTEGMVPAAQAAANAAPTQNTKLDELQAKLSVARKDLTALVAAINSTALKVKKHGGGGVAGMNNAQAADMLDGLRQQYGEAGYAEIEAIVNRIYDMNAAKLALDIESGKTNPAQAAEFLNLPAALVPMQELRDLANAVDAKNKASVDALNAKRKEVIAAVRTEYVPLSGDPTKDIDDASFHGGSGIPNVQRDYELQGRERGSPPDDGLSTSRAALMKSASYYGWRDFQDGIAAIHAAMTKEQRDAYGLHAEKVEPGRSTLSNKAVIRHRNGKTMAYIFKDEKLVEAIRGASRLENSFLLEGAGKVTKVYSYLATQANPFFAPFNFIRDSWERSEFLRTRTYLKADGSQANSKSIARTMLINVASPALMIATARYALGKPVDTNSREGRYLDEFLRQGGVSVFSSQFSSDRAKMIAQISKQSSWKQQLGILGRWIETYNKTFDVGPALASYMSMRDAGMNTKDAAAGALDLMDFGKRGKSASVFSSLYAFAQPTFTGAANMLTALRDPITGKMNKVGWTRLLAYTGGFMMLQAFLRSLADDDEGGNKLDQQSDFTKDGYLLIPYGEDGMIKVPLAYGLTRVANGIARAALGVGTNEQTYSEAVGKVGDVIVPAFSPIEDSDIDWTERPGQALLTLFAPSWLKPPVALATNTTPFDSQIVKDKWADPKKFKSEQFGKYSPEVYKDMAIALRQMTGVDMAPEEIRYIFRAYPTGILQLGINGPMENKSIGDAAQKKVYANYSEFARYFQFKKALDETDDLLKRVNAGEAVTDPMERRKLMWRLQWDEQDKELRSEKGKATRAANKAGVKTDSIDGRFGDVRMAAQVRALYYYRLMQGKDAAVGEPVEAD